MFLISHTVSHRRDDQQYVPPTKPYELSALAADLVVLARYLLKPGGRLVFFLPTVIDEYKELDLDSVLCDGMQVIANSLQDFGAWGRRVSIISISRNRARVLLSP
jgi:tRNA (guanine10-N2)-methyltransferase